jgi:hypothetical protein
MLTVLCVHVVQIEDAFHDFLTKEHVRSVRDGEELQFGLFFNMIFQTGG